MASATSNRDREVPLAHCPLVHTYPCCLNHFTGNRNRGGSKFFPESEVSKRSGAAMWQKISLFGRCSSKMKTGPPEQQMEIRKLDG